MLRKIKIQSFKSLVDVSLDLGSVNVFVGANGSGKSNLLEAVGVLSAAASGRVDDESLLRRGVRPGVPRLYKSAFPSRSDEIRPHILLGAWSEMGAKYEVTLWNPIQRPSPTWQFKTEVLYSRQADKVFGRSPSTSAKGARRVTRGLALESADGEVIASALDPNQGYAALRSVTLPQSDPASILLAQIRDYAIYSPNTPTLRGQVTDPQTREPLGLSGGRLAEALDETFYAKDAPGKGAQLDRLLELIDWARTVSSAASSTIPLSPSIAVPKKVVRFVDRFMGKDKNVLSGYDASEGALYILFAAILALHPRAARVVATDNLDQALNPRLAKGLVNTVCQWILEDKTRQWLVTCHNAAVLDGLPLQDDRVRLFVVDRNERGHTTVRRIELTDSLRRYAEQGWTLSRMWTGGLLGGVPNV